MAHNRMDDFSVAVDPRTGEIRSAAHRNTMRGPSLKMAGRDWRPLVTGAAIVMVVLVAVFAIALVSELI